MIITTNKGGNNGKYVLVLTRAPSQQSQRSPRHQRRRRPSCSKPSGTRTEELTPWWYPRGSLAIALEDKKRKRVTILLCSSSLFCSVVYLYSNTYCSSIRTSLHFTNLLTLSSKTCQSCEYKAFPLQVLPALFFRTFRPFFKFVICYTPTLVYLSVSLVLNVTRHTLVSFMSDCVSLSNPLSEGEKAVVTSPLGDDLRLFCYLRN